MLAHRTKILPYLVTALAFLAAALLLTNRSWSNPATPFFTNLPPQSISTATATTISLTGGGFPADAQLWIAPEPSTRSAITAKISTCGMPQHFVLRNDRIYVANGNAGFMTIINQSSASPMISGALDLNGQGLSLALQGDTALLAAGSGGFQFIDIRDDANPYLLSSLPEITPALDVAIAGHVAYVAAGQKGLYLVDIADPRHPRVVNTLFTKLPVFKLTIEDDLLLVSLGKNLGYVFFDVSRPERPRELSRIALEGRSSHAMVLQDKIAYIATKGHGTGHLHTVDLTQPEQPRLISTLPLRGFPLDIAYSANRLSVSLGENGIRIFELDKKRQPFPVASISAQNSSRFSLLLDQGAWVADGHGELFRFDLKSADRLTLPPILSESLNAPIITDQLIIGNDHEGIKIYAQRTESQPTLLARLAITGEIQHMLLADQRLYLSVVVNPKDNSGQLVIVDIASPAAPRITGRLPLPLTPRPVGLLGTTLILTESRAYVETGNIPPWVKPSRLLLVDVAAPEAPSLLHQFPLEAGVSGAALNDGNLLAIMQMNGRFKVIDLANANNPQEIAALQMPWIQSSAWRYTSTLIIKAGIAFISSHFSGIEVIDLRNPRHPLYLGTIDTPGPVISMALARGDMLLAGIARNGVLFVDLQRPLEPQPLGLMPLPGISQQLIPFEDHLWYTLKGNGLWSIPLPKPLKNTVDQNGNSITGIIPPGTDSGAYRFWVGADNTWLEVPGLTWMVDAGDQL